MPINEKDSLIPFELAIPSFPEEEEKVTEEIVEGQSEEQEEPEIEAEAQTTEVETEEEESQEETSEADERVEAVFNLLAEFDLIDLPEGQTYTVEQLENLKQTLPEAFFMEAVQTLSQDSQELLQYAFSLGANANRDSLKKFFEIASAVDSLPVIETAEEAEAFLEQKLSTQKAFKNKDARQVYLDSLEDEEKVALAKEFLDEEKASIEEQKKAEIEAAKQTKAQQEAQVKQYYESLTKAVEETGWKAEAQKEVLNVIQKLPDYNSAISQSTKAMVQLANFLRTFDFTKGEFDETKFELKKQSQKVNGIKKSMEADKYESILSKFSKSGTPSNTSSKKYDTLAPA